MALRGESQKTCATLLETTEIIDPDISFLQDPITNDCCYDVVAFVNPGDISDLITNDRYHYNFRYNKNLVTSATMTLQKFVGGVWSNLTSLTNDTYGTFETYGNFESDVTNESYVGYLIEWIKVQQLHGLGHYRVISEGTDIFANTGTLIGFSFCVKNWVAEQADGTVRLEWIHNKIIGNANDDLKFIDYTDLDFYQQFRIGNNSKFKWAGATLENESVWLQDGIEQDLTRKHNPNMLLTIGNAPSEIHELLLFDCFMSNVVQITDYNNLNFIRNSVSFFKKRVKLTGGYTIPDFGRSQLASLDVELEAGINNHYTHLC